MVANAVVSRSTFEKDVNEVLTILSEVEKTENYTYYKCEYISAALYKRTVIVAVFED